jgi:hypothetical protein
MTTKVLRWAAVAALVLVPAVLYFGRRTRSGCEVYEGTPCDPIWHDGWARGGSLTLIGISLALLVTAYFVDRSHASTGESDHDDR